MAHYAPIFEEIVDSSIWCESDLVVKVFLTLLAKKRKNGVVYGTAFNIAQWAKKTESEVLEALAVLSAPDTRRLEPQPYEGRRIEKVEGGWLMLNAEKYQKRMMELNRLNSHAAAQARLREREKGENCSTRHNEPARTQFVKPEQEQVKLLAAKMGLPSVEAEKFWAYYESNGWKVGKNKMVDWHKALSGWKLRLETKPGPESHQIQEKIDVPTLKI